MVAHTNRSGSFVTSATWYCRVISPGDAVGATVMASDVESALGEISTPDGKDAPSSPRIATTRIGSPGNGLPASSLASTFTVVVDPRRATAVSAPGLSSGRVDGTIESWMRPGSPSLRPSRTASEIEVVSCVGTSSRAVSVSCVPASAVGEALGRRREHRIHELAEVVRIRIRGEPEQVDDLRLPGLELDHGAEERRRLVLARTHRDRQHDVRGSPVWIARARAVGDLERDGCRTEVLVGRREHERVVVDHEVVAVRVRGLHARRVGEPHLPTADRDDVVVQLDHELVPTAHAQRLGAAVDLRQRVIQPRHPHEGIGEHRLVRRGG